MIVEGKKVLIFQNFQFYIKIGLKLVLNLQLCQLCQFFIFILRLSPGRSRKSDQEVTCPLMVTMVMMNLKFDSFPSEQQQEECVHLPSDDTLPFACWFWFILPQTKADPHKQINEELCPFHKSCMFYSFTGLVCNFQIRICETWEVGVSVWPFGLHCSSFLDRLLLRSRAWEGKPAEVWRDSCARLPDVDFVSKRCGGCAPSCGCFMSLLFVKVLWGPHSQTVL